MDEKIINSNIPLFFTIGVLLLLAITHRWQILPIPALDQTVELELFSAGRAYEVLEKINPKQLAHPADSVENRAVERVITTLLSELGYQTETQESQICDVYDDGEASCLNVRNIIVHIKGREQNSGILLSAHYDSVSAGPGVSDAGVAVGSLLEIARLLATQIQPRNSIILLFNEGEENGLKGAKAFMQEHALAKELKVAINIEARGSSGQSILFETGDNSGWLVEQYAKTTPAPLSSSLFYEAYKFMPNNTDLTVFKEYGLQGINFAHAENVAHYHTKLDNLSNLNLGSLQHHGDNVWGVLNVIKDLELNQVKQGNQVFTDVFGLFMVQWYEKQSIDFSIALTFLFFLVYYLRNKIAVVSVKTLFNTLAGVAAVIILSATAGHFLQELVSIINGSRMPWWSEPLPMLSALWLSVFFVTLLVSTVLTKATLVIDLTLGLLFTWLLLSILTSIAMPGVSYLFILPTLLGLLSMLIVNCYLFKENDLAVISTAIIVCVTSGVLFIPVVYNLELMLSFESSLIIALFLGFVTAGLIPLIAFANTKRSVVFSTNAGTSFGTNAGNSMNDNVSTNTVAHNRLSSKLFGKVNTLTLGVVVMLITMLFGISGQTAFTSFKPQAINLYYVQKADNSAFVVTSVDKAELPIALNLAIPYGKEQKVFPWPNGRAYAQEISSRALSAVDVTLVESKPIEILLAHQRHTGREVKILLTSDKVQLSAIELYINKDSGLVSINNGINTVTYQHERNHRSDYIYQCEGVSCAEMQLTLTFDNTKNTTMLIAQVKNGLPLFLQSIADSRSDIAVPSHNGDRSYVLTEIEF